VTEPRDTGRTHEPSLREVTAELDGLRDLMDERDRRYGSQFDASKEAVAAALAAQKELTSQAFTASKEAISKAEATSNLNDAKNNEFRGQLRDQAATFPTRTEVDARIDALTSRFEEFKNSTAVEIRSLRESRSEGVGSKVTTTEYRAQTNVDRTLVVSIILAGAAIAAAVLYHH